MASSSYSVSSIQLGRVRTRETADGRKWRSAIDKQPAKGPIHLGREGLDGDAQADHRFHGGPDRALLAYCGDHFAGWASELGGPPPAPGAFGENLTVRGLPETEACIGDSFRLGEAEVQITQPRVPCVKLERHLEAPGIVERAFDSQRTGFYLRVLREGLVSAGPLALLDRPNPRLTVALALRLLLDPAADEAAMNALVACPVLSEGYRGALRRARSVR